jgi:hypothetical protein
VLTLRDTSLNWALQHALNFGDTDAFPLPFEDRAIHLFGGDYQVILVEPDNWHDGRSFSWAPGNDGVKGGRRSVRASSPRDVLLFPRLCCCYGASMDRDTAMAQIRKACNAISVELMNINPAVSALGDKEAQDEIYRTVFELTKEVETIKKRLAKLERSDESRDL